MSPLSMLLSQPVPADTAGLGETIAFWILGPLALAGALAMIFARNAVHSALWLAQTMLCLGALYLVQQAPFLGFVQIIVYTGAIMMLFLFVLMLVGKANVDSLVEVLRGQRVAAALGGIGLAALLGAMLGRAVTGITAAGLGAVNTTGGGNVANLGRVLYTSYLFPFELTSALLITAALGSMVLAFTERLKEGRLTQRERAQARFRGPHPTPLPGPGVFATTDSVATPALLPDGSVAPGSLSELLEPTPRQRMGDGARDGTRALPAPGDGSGGPPRPSGHSAHREAP